MKRKLSTIIAVAALAGAAQAGELNIVGNVNVGSNLTANVTTLRGATNLTSAVLDFTKPGLFYQYTLTNDTTWVFTNHVAGRQVWLQVAQGNGGGWQSTWPANLLWAGGGVPNCLPTTNRFSVFKVLDNGEYWLAQAEGLDYRVSCLTNCNFGVQFDGSHNYATGDFSTPASVSDFTIEAWFKTTATTDGTIFYADAGDLAHYLGPTIYGGELYCNGYGIYDGNSGVTVTDGVWHHVAEVYTVASGAIETFLDGASVVVNYPGNIPNQIGRVWVGCWWDVSLTFNGLIDEVRISNTNRYTTNFVKCSVVDLTNDTHTVALWKFNAGEGPTAADSSGQGAYDHIGGFTIADLVGWVRL